MRDNGCPRLNAEYLSESKYMSGPKQEMYGRESRATGATCPGIGAETEVRQRMWGQTTAQEVMERESGEGLR